MNAISHTWHPEDALRVLPLSQVLEIARVMAARPEEYEVDLTDLDEEIARWVRGAELAEDERPTLRNVRAERRTVR